MSPRRKKARKPNGTSRAKSRAPLRPARRPGKKSSGAKPFLLQGIHAAPAAQATVGEWFEALVGLQSRLRAPGGCPWDREQTHESLRKFLIEETYEVLDAMESGDPRRFSSELGDLLLQVVFHSMLAEESGSFTIADVIESVHTKMVRRHPHVFGNTKAGSSAEVLKNWEEIKAAERAVDEAGRLDASKRTAADESILAGVPRSFPAVLEAYQLTRRASHVGFDWDNLGEILEKLDEEKRELISAMGGAAPADVAPAVRGNANADKPSAHLEEEMGDVLFVAVNIARFLGVDPEIALKKANRKFKARFARMERAATGQGSRFADLQRARMEELWNESKRFKESE